VQTHSHIKLAFKAKSAENHKINCSLFIAIFNLEFFNEMETTVDESIFPYTEVLK
jgi:hypothetical protein